jgi:ATP-dependent DNA helicase RecQ
MELDELLLFIAPPAWGKTSKLISLKREMPKTTFIFVSPLRALSDEFAKRLSHEFKTLWVQKKSDTKQDFMLFDWVIMTCEMLTERKVQSLCQKKVIFILDEFHLFYYWDSFRDDLIRLYRSMIDSQKACLLLTATMSEEHLSRLKEEVLLNRDTLHILTIDNQVLKNHPQDYLYFPALFKSVLKHKIRHLKPGKPKLLFCQFRNEVLYWKKYYQEKGLKVISCVGGESREFSEIINNHHYDLIVATTVISHGVNLPPISEILFTYPLKNRDFWVQMVGRGGRSGESFTCYAYDLPYYFTFWDHLWNIGKILKLLIVQQYESRWNYLKENTL